MILLLWVLKKAKSLIFFFKKIENINQGSLLV